MEDGEESLVNTWKAPTSDYSLSDAHNPLRGVILCCTSIPPEQRTKLAEQAEQMGAQHQYDLTSEVTHFIVGDYNTPKYQYVARNRSDVKILRPSFIEAIRDLWIHDHPVNVHAMEKEHTLPTFIGLRVCLTGFDDQEQRQKIINLVQANGGEYHGDLTKKVTHLVAYKPEGAKYKHGKTWGLNVVSVEWFRDSLERGMILEETLYNPEWPVDERGKGAWIRQKTSPLGKRIRIDSKANLEEGKRKLRRTASTKLTSQNEKIWGDIVGGSATVEAAGSVEWNTMAEDAAQDKESVAVAQKALPKDRNDLSHRTLPAITQGTFSGCHFYIHGFERNKLQVLRTHLLSHGAQIASSLDNLTKQFSKQLYLVVPHSHVASKVPEVPQSTTPIEIVTDWWIERCLGAKCIVDPAEYILGRPFPVFPLLRFNILTVCSTGFDGMPLLHLSKVVALMGAKYEESFSKDASVLICNPIQNMRKEKLSSAQEWKIPVVSLDWLLETIQKGERQPFKPYLQRLRKAKTEPARELPIDEECLANEPTQNDTIGIKVSQRPAIGDARPPDTLKLDPTAFQVERPPQIKEEDPPIAVEIINAHEALNEISTNSTRRTPSPSKSSVAPSPRHALPAIPQAVINTAINSLLAKSKPITTSNSEEAHQVDDRDHPRKKRAPSRILGRATSNVSTAASERASSVDSTASNGAAVAWPSSKSKSTSNSRSLRGARAPSDLAAIAMMRDLEAAQMVEEEGQQAPPQTQMHYQDPEAAEYKARVLARVTGEKLVEKRREVVLTIGSLDGGSSGGMAPRTRTRKTRV